MFKENKSTCLSVVNNMFSFFLIILLFFSCSSPKKTTAQTILEPNIRIGVAWRSDTTSSTFRGTLMAIREAGAEPVVIGPILSPDIVYDGDSINPVCLDEPGILKPEYADIIKRDTYKGIDVRGQYLNNIDAIVFPGGEDMSPALFTNPQPWHGIEEEIYYDPKRDVSDYILMSWCLDNDMPMLCICRGMQVLTILSGSPMIQDLAAFFHQQDLPYNFEHRGQTEEGRCFACHDVNITDTTSILYNIVGSTVIHDTPSWHHQAAEFVNNPNLKVTAVTNTSGIDIIEAVERTDKTWVVGIQFHPEIAVKKHLENASDASQFMTYEEGMKYFHALVNIVKKSKN